MIAFLAAALTACGPIKEAVTPGVREPALPLAATLQAMKDSETHFDFFATRFSGVATVDNSSYNISGNIRIRKDSAIFVSVSPLLGIEMARILITPEKVGIINRLEGTYFEGDMAYVNSILNTQLDFHMLQSMLVGNDFEHFNRDNFRASTVEDRLLLQDTERYPLTGSAMGQSFQQNLWLHPDTHRITENLLYDPNTLRSMRTRYGSFKQVNGQDVPGELWVTLAEPGARAEISIRYTRTSIDEPASMHFSVPDRYRRLD